MPSRSGPESSPSRSMSVIDEGARRLEAREALGHGERRRRRPALDGDDATSVVEGDGDGDAVGDRVDQRGIGDRRRPHDDTGHATVGERGGIVERSARHRRPGAGARPSTAAAIAAITARFEAVPLRAASRSTTWIHRRRLGETFGDADGVVAVGRLPVVVTLAQAHDVPAADVDRRVQLRAHRRRRRKRWRPAHEVAEQRQSARRRLLRMELHGGDGPVRNATLSRPP